MHLPKRRDKSNDLWLSENEVTLLCFINGEGGQQVNLDKNLSLDLLSIVIPQHSIEKLIEYNAQVFDSFSAFTQCQDNTHLFLKGNRPVEKTVIKAANDLNQARLMGNNAYRYMESKIIDCLSGFLMPGYLTPEKRLLQSACARQDTRCQGHHPVTISGHAFPT